MYSAMYIRVIDECNFNPRVNAQFWFALVEMTLSRDKTVLSDPELGTVSSIKLLHQVR